MLNERWNKQWEAHGYEAPTDVQKALYQPIKNGEAIIAASATGTGKTVAYLLPMLEKITPEPKTQWLVLAPAHELVMQISDVIRSWIEPEEKIDVMPIIGGANVKRQIEKLKKKPQIVVATPGRALELIKQKKLKMHEIEAITLDESDQLLRQENFASTLEIVNSAKRDRQLILVSATKLEEPERFFAQVENEITYIDIQTSKQSTDNIAHQYMEVEHREKGNLLKRLSFVKGMQALVFVKDKPRMDILLEKLQFDGVKAAGIHGDINREIRKKVLRQFKNKEITFLVVTDVAARGLDIPDLPYVIQYDMPLGAREYTHRSGRTGRMGKAGNVITFASPREIRTLKQYYRDMDVKGQFVQFYHGEIQAKTTKPVRTNVNVRKPHKKKKE